MMAKKKSKELQGELMDSAHKIWLAGLGALATAEEGSSKLFKSMVEKGRGIEDMGKERVEKAKGAMTGMKSVAESYWDTLEKTLDEKITGVINRLGVPTKDEIATLTKKVEDLTKSIDKMRAAESPAKTTRTSKAKETPAS